MGRARAAIRQRVGPAIESHRRDMRSSLSDYKTALEAAAADLPFTDRERVETAIADNLRVWESDGHRIPQTPPAAFGAIGGAGDLHSRHFEKQAAIQRTFDTAMSSLAGIYVLELQNLIGSLEKDGNTTAADALEEEVRAVNADPNRFRSIMLD